jgi:hypothetical protein
MDWWSKVLKVQLKRHLSELYPATTRVTLPVGLIFNSISEYKVAQETAGG